MSGSAGPGLEDVFAHVDANRASFVERLAGWVRTPSVSATGEGMPEAAGYARDLVAANAAATVARFVLLRSWVFHPQRTSPFPRRGSLGLQAGEETPLPPFVVAGRR